MRLWSQTQRHAWAFLHAASEDNTRKTKILERRNLTVRFRRPITPIFLVESTCTTLICIEKFSKIKMKELIPDLVDKLELLSFREEINSVLDTGISEELKFRPIFQLIQECKKGKNPFKEFLSPVPEDILRKFYEIRNICEENYVEVMKLAVFSEYWTEVDFSRKNTIPNGSFSQNNDFGESVDPFKYQSNIADRLHIGSKIDFTFKNKPTKFEVSDICNDKIYMKTAGKKQKQTTICVSGKPEKLKIIPGDNIVLSRLKALSEGIQKSESHFYKVSVVQIP